MEKKVNKLDFYDLNDFEKGDEIYYIITLDTTSSYEKEGEEYDRQILYINGQKLYERGYNKNQWDNMKR